MEETAARLRRPAIVLDVGGARPSDDPYASWFGHVGFGEQDEEWPSSNGRPMLPLCQLNLTLLPFRPPGLDDLAAIAVFIDSEVLPDGTPNGSGWLLRAYRNLDSLVQLDDIGGWPIKRLPLFARLVDDYPCLEDVPTPLLQDLADSYYDSFENASGLKLGGWPSLIQSEVEWAPSNQHPAAPEYVFQIDSSEKAGWAWGDGGVGYFGRGTASGHTDEWVLAWQCY